MFQEFYRHSKQNGYWKEHQKIMLAISGGIDSMVLLALMQQAAAKDHLTLAVAHVNHQLREESSDEAAYLKDYCQKHNLAYYSKTWTEQDKTKNTEARAREFRYAFFAEIMEQEDYSVLMTAHHSDDQAETILMKLTRGSALSNLVGIREKQVFGKGYLIRPLLGFPKESFRQVAKQLNVIYFDDYSNAEDTYMRNRIRHHVVPALKKENQQFLKQIAHFSEQVALATELIQSVIAPKYERWVTKTAFGWSIGLTELQQESKSIQTFFLQSFLQQTLVPKGVIINQTHIQQLLNMINQATPQGTIDFEQSWQVVKEYDHLFVKKRNVEQTQKNIQLTLNEHMFLSENEWFGVESSEKKISIPEAITDWEEISFEIKESTLLPLTIRHRENGDRIALTHNLNKRLNRLFIDQKIPNSIRAKAWVILSAADEVIWVPRFANSHLSIPQETDKILYRLLYRIKE